VSEQRRAGVLLAADGALPKDNARGQYMNTDNGAVRSSLLCAQRVKANGCSAQGRPGVAGAGHAECEWAAGGYGGTRESERSASVYV
jgi:hypothetical protein